jgi:hypothetical protein
MRLRISRILDSLTNLILSKKRIDHNPMYICIMVWDLFAGAYAVYVGLPDAAMSHMTVWAQHIICWLMFLGGLACVGGIVMGTRVDPGYWIRTLRGKTNQVDVRLPYLLGMLGTPMLTVGFFYYSVAILGQMSWQSTMASEASLSLAVGVGVAINFIRFIMEIRKINIWLPVLIEQKIIQQLSPVISDSGEGKE